MGVAHVGQMWVSSLHWMGKRACLIPVLVPSSHSWCLHLVTWADVSGKMVMGATRRWKTITSKLARRGVHTSRLHASQVKEREKGVFPNLPMPAWWQRCVTYCDRDNLQTTVGLWVAMTLGFQKIWGIRHLWHFISSENCLLSFNLELTWPQFYGEVHCYCNRFLSPHML